MQCDAIYLSLGHKNISILCTYSLWTSACGPYLVSQPQQEAGMGGQQHIPQLQKPIGQQHPALLFGYKDRYTEKMS